MPKFDIKKAIDNHRLFIGIVGMALYLWFMMTILIEFGA